MSECACMGVRGVGNERVCMYGSQWSWPDLLGVVGRLVHCDGITIEANVKRE